MRVYQFSVKVTARKKMDSSDEAELATHTKNFFPHPPASKGAKTPFSLVGEVKYFFEKALQIHSNFFPHPGLQRGQNTLVFAC